MLPTMANDDPDICQGCGSQTEEARQALAAGHGRVPLPDGSTRPFHIEQQCSKCRPSAKPTPATKKRR
jgi:hypothetical protein